MTPPEQRTRACQRRLRERGAGGMVLSPGSNLQYLTGCTETPSERLFVCLVPPSGDPRFVVPHLSGQQVREATWVDDVRTWSDGTDPSEPLGAALSTLFESGEILLDETMWARFVLQIQAACADARAFGLAGDVLGSLRARKDESEITALRDAGAVADSVVATLRADATGLVGQTETELAREIERRLADAGGTGVSFEPIVATGPNGAKPHHEPGDTVVEAGDPVVLDFGTRVDGYPSDTTRTLVFDGDPSDEFEAVHDVVKRAQAAAIDAVEPGVQASAIDARARAVIEDAGYGEAFVHRTGHGVGLDVHEEPYISSDSETKLESGMVFSVEPGVYLEGRFGVRIEDLVVVTEDGCERLNTSSRNWRVDG